MAMPVRGGGTRATIVEADRRGCGTMQFCVAVLEGVNHKGRQLEWPGRQVKILSAIFCLGSLGSQGKGLVESSLSLSRQNGEHVCSLSPTMSEERDTDDEGSDYNEKYEEESERRLAELESVPVDPTGLPLRPVRRAPIMWLHEVSQSADNFWSDWNA